MKNKVKSTGSYVVDSNGTQGVPVTGNTYADGKGNLSTKGDKNIWSDSNAD